MRTFIICNGEITNYNYTKNLIKEDDFIICADGGTRHAFNMGIRPDLIIGDLDSTEDFYVDYYENHNIKFIKHPRDKDKTDTHICILHALEFSEEIVLIGALGSRIDHSLANIFLLKLGLTKNIPIHIDDYQNQVFLMDKFIEISGNPNDFFSLIPFSGKVEGLNVKGAKYDLKDAELDMVSSLGISNAFKEKQVTISIEKGCLIVIKSID